MQALSLATELRPQLKPAHGPAAKPEHICVPLFSSHAIVIHSYVCSLSGRLFVDRRADIVGHFYSSAERRVHEDSDFRACKGTPKDET